MHIENLTVFIIDDDAQVRDSIALMLGLMGFRTVVFDSAEAFLAAYKADWAGCVIVDLRLPGQSGLELQRELRALNSALPVVVITAHGDVATARAAFQANAVDFLEKPFDDAQLRAAIKTAFALEERRIQRFRRSPRSCSAFIDAHRTGTRSDGASDTWSSREGDCCSPWDQSAHR